MLFWSRMMILAAVVAAVSCGGAKPPATPLETFKTYTKAIKQKDTTTMKILLSDATIKMHEKEAKAQGVTVDDIVKRETLFSESQKTVEFRGEKIEGDKASLQVKNAYQVWETVPFVREDGVWKIDKAGYADQLMKDIEEENKEIDQMVNGGNNDSSGIDGIAPSPTPTP